MVGEEAREVRVVGLDEILHHVGVSGTVDFLKKGLWLLVFFFCFHSTTVAMISWKKFPAVLLFPPPSRSCRGSVPPPTSSSVPCPTFSTILPATFYASARPCIVSRSGYALG